MLRLGRRVDLPAALMSRLEDSAGQLVSRLAAMMLDPGVNVTLETMVGNLIEMTDIINATDPGAGEWNVTGGLSKAYAFPRTIKVLFQIFIALNFKIRLQLKKIPTLSILTLSLHVCFQSTPPPPTLHPC